MLLDERPLVAAIDLLHWATLTEKRDRKGSEWCAEKGIGRERRRFKPATGATPFSKPEQELRRAIGQAEGRLREICHDCPLRCARR